MNSSSFITIFRDRFSASHCLIFADARLKCVSRLRRRTRGRSDSCCRSCRVSWPSRWSGTSRWRRKSPAEISSRSSFTRFTFTDTNKSPSCLQISKDLPVKLFFGFACTICMFLVKAKWRRQLCLLFGILFYPAMNFYCLSVFVKKNNFSLFRRLKMTWNTSHTN